MLNFKKTKQLLCELEEKKLFNKFIVDLLNYKLYDFDKLIIRYKIKNELIIDIFDYKKNKKFIRYYFTKDDKHVEKIDNDTIVKVIKIKRINKNLNNNDKLSLFGALFCEKDINIIKKILTMLFDKEINLIIMKYL